MKYKIVNKRSDSKALIIGCKPSKIELAKTISGIKSLTFNGEFGNGQLVYATNGQKLFLVGLGDENDANRRDAAFKKLIFNNKKGLPQYIQLITENLTPADIKQAVLGIELANYQIGQFKSKKENNNQFTLEVVTNQKLNDVVTEAHILGSTINKIKGLIDAPANIKTPMYLAEWAKTSSKENNYKCKVISGDQLTKQGFHAVIAVGKGSVNQPAVIVTEHRPKPKAKIDLVLVGKGITFDSGGLSIKPSTNLHYMKSDMGGSAVVLGVMEAVAKLNLKINVVGIVASAENAVDMNSYRPGDVINSYSGKTIEIIDTDAEGRLVLADGINYAIKKYQPKQIIDLATLTGSVVRTFGYAAAGMFTNNDAMAEAMSKVGELEHERVWRLPLYKDYESDLASDIADIRNFSGKPIAGAINAAKFLEAFTENHNSWLHLDIAGVAFGDSEFSKMKSATGYGVKLITSYIKSLI